MRHINPNTTKVIAGVGTNTVTIPAFSTESGIGQVMVIDFITYTALSGASAETWLLTVKDVNTNLIWKAKESVAATTADTMHLIFPRGLPCWSMTSGATDNGLTPGSTVVALAGQTGADATSQLTVGYHYAVMSELRE